MSMGRCFAFSRHVSPELAPSGNSVAWAAIANRADTVCTIIHPCHREFAVLDQRMQSPDRGLTAFHRNKETYRMR